MATTHQVHGPTVHRSTFVPPRREARAERSLREAHRRRRRAVLIVAVSGVAALVTASGSTILLTR
ncbi:hypothetical protein [Labedella endophytica]|uniref:Uncharacterized protein n=1 Tax=Labedella endophytica TaxID=1523160 RepID=A0A3S0VDD0_9MICO|nr:hypothetical protein [Labedella endophytica]RUR03429.1 hypothetical protein ELQ94_02485 [Labedella endophytica]